MGLKMMLKALGINVSEEHIAQAEKLIPQLPKVLNDAIAVINATIAKADERLTALETSNQHLIVQNETLKTIITSISEHQLELLHAIGNVTERSAARNGGSGSGRKRTTVDAATNGSTGNGE